MTIAVDTSTLEDLISTLIDLSMDGRVPASQQQIFLGLAKRLRGSLLNLLTARFDDDTQEVTYANAGLKAVNDDVATLATNLARASTVVQEINKTVGQLDDLLTIAEKFA